MYNKLRKLKISNTSAAASGNEVRSKLISHNLSRTLHHCINNQWVFHSFLVSVVKSLLKHLNRVVSASISNRTTLSSRVTNTISKGLSLTAVGIDINGLDHARRFSKTIINSHKRTGIKLTKG